MSLTFGEFALTVLDERGQDGIRGIVRPFPITHADGDPAHPKLLHMKTRSYYVVATDPAADWRCDMLTVRSAVSRDEAKRRAREQLAKVRRDHWLIDLVVEAEAVAS